MDWKAFLKSEVDTVYKTTSRLLDFVDENQLEWKPSTGNNWMTTSHLLHHITNACGMCFKGFVTGDWGMPEGMDVSDLKPEEMLPPAEKMPRVNSVAEAKKLLEEDQAIAYKMLDQVSEDELATKTITAPWDPTEKILGQQLKHMIDHLIQHKTQLFYYLKLQDQPVNSTHLYGMA